MQKNCGSYIAPGNRMSSKKSWKLNISYSVQEDFGTTDEKGVVLPILTFNYLVEYV